MKNILINNEQNSGNILFIPGDKISSVVYDTKSGEIDVCVINEDEVWTAYIDKKEWEKLLMMMKDSNTVSLVGRVEESGNIFDNTEE